jgi:hypothetical protein
MSTTLRMVPMRAGARAPAKPSPAAAPVDPPAARSGDPPNLLTRVCPNCGPCAAFRSVASQPAAEDADFSVAKIFFTYSRCAGCGLLYARRYLAPAAAAALYAEMPENMAGVPARLLEKTQRGYFEFFRALAPTGGTYLEVGPDTGLFTQFVARECRFDDHVLFEPNRTVLAELTGRLRGRPHRIHPGFLDFGAVPDGSVSAAALIHVLDHLLDPLGTLRLLRRKMRPGGLAMVVVHDESSLLARVLGSRWPAYCPQHPQIFRPATLGALFERAGFRVAATSASVNHFPLAYLARHLAFALKLGRWPALLPESDLIRNRGASRPP